MLFKYIKLFLVFLLLGVCISCNSEAMLSDVFLKSQSQRIYDYVNQNGLIIHKTKGNSEIYSKYQLLGFDAKTNEIYLYVVTAEYYIVNNLVFNTDASGVPVVLKVKKENDELIVISHKTPRDGDYWGGDFRKMFPRHIRDQYNQDPSLSMKLAESLDYEVLKKYEQDRFGNHSE